MLKPVKKELMINTIEGGGHVEQAEQRDMSVVSRRQSVRRHAQHGRLSRVELSVG